MYLGISWRGEGVFLKVPISPVADVADLSKDFMDKVQEIYKKIVNDLEVITFWTV